MKFLVACIFAVAVMSALFLDSTNAQRPDCTVAQIGAWGAANLTPQCGTALILFNQTWQTPAGAQALDQTCTDDSCGGAVYRYLLTQCSPQQAFVQQQRCATNGTIRCFYGEWPTAYPSTFNSTAFSDLFTICALSNATNPCPDGCAAALWTIRRNIGCCFNNYYNSSLPNNPWRDVAPLASYQLWTACQVPTLDRCPEILSPNAPTTMPTTMPTAGSATIAASLVVLLILATTNIFFGL